MNISRNLLEDKNSLFDVSSFKNKVLTQANKFEQPNKDCVSLDTRSLLLANLDVLNSKKSDEHSFTNFLNLKCKTDCIQALYKILSKLKNGNFLEKSNFDLDEDLDSMNYRTKNRLCDILKLYCKNNSITISDLANITKAKVKTLQGLSTSFRIYIQKTEKDYRIILLDPLHFAVPSKMQYTNKYQYKDHKSNNLCIRNHIIIKDPELNKIYLDLKNTYKE